MNDVKNFEEFLEETKKEFRKKLNADKNLMKEFYSEFLLQAYDKCTSGFEEETLIENLQEVYGEFLRAELIA